jgi:hypothetical protein
MSSQSENVPSVYNYKDRIKTQGGEITAKKLIDDALDLS